MYSDSKNVGLRQVVYLIRSDLYRYEGAKGVVGFVRKYMREPGFRFTFWMRLASALRTRNAMMLGYLIALWQRHRMDVRYGISIPHTTTIGPGLFIGHFGGIVVNARVRIGRNCNLSHSVTIGQSNRGKRAGVPTIADCVYLGPGCKVIGAVTIGSHAAVGANAVVTRDVGEMEVVAGVPATVISKRGSAGYIEYTEYDAVLGRVWDGSCSRPT